ncbi:putative transposase, Ptta/En/Spm, plant [Helianthus anomalus]
MCIYICSLLGLVLRYGLLPNCWYRVGSVYHQVRSSYWTILTPNFYYYSTGTLKNGKKKSEAGRANRKNDLCLHTGGSIRFDHHRVNMDKEKGKSVGYLKVFLQTHATKECKKMLKDGEITKKDFDRLKFVTE